MSTYKHLFHLIEGLGRDEKRHFRLLSARQEKEASYLTLFDKIEQLLKSELTGSEWDEEKFLKRLKRLWKDGDMDEARDYLYKNILRSLRLLQESENKETDIKITLQEAKILEKRAMFDAAAEKYRSALKSAQKYEYPALAVEALKGLIYLTGQRDLNDYLVKMQEYIRELRTLAEDGNRESALFALHYEAFLTWRTKKNQTTGTIQTLVQNIKQQGLPEALPSNAGFWSKIYTEYALISLALLEGRRDAAFTGFGKILAIWDEYDLLKKEYVRQYVIFLSNYLTYCIAGKHFDEYHRCFEVLKNINPSGSDDQAEHFQNRVYIQQLYYVNNGEFEAAVGMVDEIKAGLKKYHFKINKSRELTLRYNILLSYFALEQFEAAHAHAFEIVNMPRSQHRPDIQSVAKIFLLLVQYEKNDHTELDTRLRSVAQNLNYNENLFGFERTVLKYLGKLIRVQMNALSVKQAKEEANPIFLDFKNELIELQTKSLQQKPFGFEEILLWVRSKLGEGTFRALLKE
jgi:hypothetical protein